MSRFKPGDRVKVYGSSRHGHFCTEVNGEICVVDSLQDDFFVKVVMSNVNGPVAFHEKQLRRLVKRRKDKHDKFIDKSTKELEQLKAHSQAITPKKTSHPKGSPILKTVWQWRTKNPMTGIWHVYSGLHTKEEMDEIYKNTGVIYVMLQGSMVEVEE